MALTNGVYSQVEDNMATEKEVLSFFNLIFGNPDAKIFHEILLANQTLREKNAKLSTAYDQISDTVEEKKKAWRDAQAQSASKDAKLAKLEAEKKQTVTELEKARKELEATSEGMTAQQRRLKELQGKQLQFEKDLAQKK